MLNADSLYPSLCVLPKLLLVNLQHLFRVALATALGISASLFSAVVKSFDFRLACLKFSNFPFLKV